MLKLDEIVNLVVNNGVAVGVVIYFLWRDYRYNERMVLLLNDIKNIVSLIKESEVDRK